MSKAVMAMEDEKMKTRDAGVMAGILPMLVLCEGTLDSYGIRGIAVLALVSLAVGAAAAGFTALKKERRTGNG